MYVFETADKIYVTRSAYYDKKCNEKIIKASSVLEDLSKFLTKKLKIKKRPEIFVQKQRSNNKRTKIYSYGMVTVEGNIIIDPRFSLSSIVNTICHEFVHVSQIQRGDLKFSRNNPHIIIWKGKRMIYNPSIMNGNLEDYCQLPWEAEAYALQDKLEAAYLKRGQALLDFLKNK